MTVPEFVQDAARRWGFAVLGVAALLLMIGVVGWELREKSRIHATISMGPSREKRATVVLDGFAREAATYHLDLEIVGTESLIDQFRKVDANTLDFALVPGGFNYSHYKNVRQVAALVVQPLHLLVKEELAESAAGHLNELRGKLVNLGPEHSGPYWLAREVLGFAGLNLGADGKTGDFVVSTLGITDVLKIADRDKMPDAIFLLSGLPSGFARDLIIKHRYRLVPMPFRDAFSLGALQPSDLLSHVPPEGAIEVRKEHIVEATIPAFTYRVDPGNPPTTLKTIGVRLLVISNRKSSQEKVQRFLETLMNTRLAKLTTPPVDTKMLEEAPEIPWHPGVTAYLDRDKPFLTHTLVDTVKYWFTLCVSGLGSILCLVQWYKSGGRKVQSVKASILAVNDVEKKLMEQELAGLPDLEVLLELDREIGRIKLEAVDQLRVGPPKDESLMPTFLAHLNDTRSHIERMIRKRKERETIG